MEPLSTVHGGAGAGAGAGGGRGGGGGGGGRGLGGGLVFNTEESDCLTLLLANYRKSS